MCRRTTNNKPLDFWNSLVYTERQAYIFVGLVILSVVLAIGFRLGEAMR